MPIRNLGRQDRLLTHLIEIKPVDLTHPHHTQRLFVFLLAVALVRGLMYAVAIPLWHASDEANHTEYVLFILWENRLPQPGDVAADVRREILASLWEDERTAPVTHSSPGALLGETPPSIPGPSEFSHPPIYYLFIATLLRPLAHHGVTTLAYAARLGSVLLGVTSLGLTILAARAFFSRRPWAVWAIPVLVLFIPAHTFSNSTINNDQLAEVVMSVFFYLWVLAFQKGLSWRKAFALIGIALIGLYTKRTTAISVPLILVGAIIVAGRRLSGADRRWRWGILLALVAVGVCLAVVALDSEAVAGWYATGNVSRSNHVNKSGEHSMHLAVDPVDKNLDRATVYQVLPPQALEIVRGKEVTFGLWTKGNQDAKIQLGIGDGSHWYQKSVTGTDDWQFHQIRGVVGQNAPELRMWMAAQASASADVYVDDLSLLVTHGDGQNVLYNGSAEKSAWMLRPWVKALAAKLEWLRLDPNGVQSVLDVGESWRFRDILVGIVDNLFKLFWATFGVRQVYVGQMWFYLLAVVHLFAGVGLVRAWIRHCRAESHIPRWLVEFLLFALLSAIVAVFAAIARGYPLGSMRFVPAGRYLYVVMVPYAFLMVTGIGSWIPRRYHSLAVVAATVMLVSFDALCMFYYVIPQWYG